MPTLTPADALIQAVDNLTLAIAGVILPPIMTTDAIDQLMHIFKQQAKNARNNATVQRVLKERAHAERVLTKAEPNPTPTTTPRAAPTANPTTSFPDLEIEYPNRDMGQPQQTLVVSQDDHKSVSPPSTNTHHQCMGRTITEDFPFHMMDVPTPTQPFTTQQAASRKFPLQFICNFASALLDNETGDISGISPSVETSKIQRCMERVIWQGNLTPHNNHQDHCLHGKARARRRDITYGRIVCNYPPEKKDLHHTHI